MPGYKELFSDQAFRNDASLAIIVGPTVDPLQPTTKMHQYGAFISREDKHSHPIGQDKDIVYANPIEFAEELLFMGCNMIYGQGDKPLLLFEQADAEIFSKLGLTYIKSYNFYILTSNFATIDAVLSDPKNRNLVAQLSNKKIDILLSYTPDPTLLSTPEKFQQLYSRVGGKIIEFFNENKREVVYDKVFQHILRHEFEHFLKHLLFGFSVTFDQLAEHMYRLLSASVLSEQEFADLRSCIDAALSLTPNLELLAKHAIQSHLVYLESTAMLAEFLTNPDSEEYQIQPLSVLMRIALFLHSLCSMLELSSSSQKISEHDHAMMNILFGRLLSVNECKNYLFSDEMINNIENFLFNPGLILNENTWQTLYFQFTSAEVEICNKVKEMLRTLDHAMLSMGVKFCGQEIEFRDERISLPPLH